MAGRLPSDTISRGGRKQLKDEDWMGVDGRTRGDIRVWSPRGKQDIAVGSDVRIRSQWTMYVDTPLRFVAKVALSTGYFVYGNIFRRAVAHDQIRFLMEFDLAGVTPEEKAELERRVATMGIQAEVWLRPDDSPDLEVYRLLSRAYGYSSVVGLVPTRSSVTVFVGVLGLYIGLVDAPAETIGFPLGGTHDVGHVIVLREGRSSDTPCVTRRVGSAVC